MSVNFTTEEEMVSHITSLNESTLHSFVKGNNHSVFRELNLGYGIADIVAVTYTKKHRVRKNSLAYFDISLLSYIEKNERVTFDDIVFITKSPTAKINHSLASLMDEQFVVYREGHYVSNKKYMDLLTDSIAIEAKLKDWKRALKQAYRYKWFSNKAYVFLPVENIAVPEKNIDMFKKLNVGLASVCKSNGIEVKFAPVNEAPLSNTMRMAFSEFLLFQDNTTLGSL